MEGGGGEGVPVVIPDAPTTNAHTLVLPLPYRHQ